MSTQKTKPAPTGIYKQLADKIRNTTEGVEYDENEIEVQYNGKYYIVSYILERHWDEIFDSNDREYLTILNWRVEDSEGDPVTNVTMNPEEIENYFDKKPNYSDKD